MIYDASNVRDVVVSRAKGWVSRFSAFPGKIPQFAMWLLMGAGWSPDWGKSGYCMAGVFDCWKEVGFFWGIDKDGDGFIEWSERTATPQTAFEIAMDRGIYLDMNGISNVKAGDAFFSKEHSSKDDVTHAGIVIDVISDDEIRCVEFNWVSGGRSTCKETTRSTSNGLLKKVVGFASLPESECTAWE